MKIITKSIVLLGIGLAILSCSRKKNTFLSRNWHAITAEYNTLYNGNRALELGKEELIANYQDNYWNILPVERMQVKDEILLPGDSRNPNFAIAEEKAVKAIQQHSMLIDGRERNPQIDEAYLLLGKARYYNQRFVPALEAFNYILHKYPVSNSINEANIWREKANMRLDFNQIALENLKKLLEYKSLKKEERSQALASLAQAYINLEELDSAVAPISKAARFTKNEDKRGRYLFIKGQLYDLLGKKDSAVIAFNKIIDLKRKTPRIYRINAFVQKIHTLSEKPGNEEIIYELLSELQENRENRPFLDKIYFELAQFHYQQDSVALAMEYYNKSIRSTLNNTYLQSLGYRTLGNIYFDAANYEAAGAYFDSTLLKLPEDSREFRFIKKKRDNLADVIYYEGLARKNDSILYLSDLSKEEQLQFFTRYTENLKSVAIAAAKNPNQENLSAQAGGIEGFVPSATVPPGLQRSTFYFYNPTTVALGQQEFREIWGNRPLADNWRTNKNSGKFEEIEEESINHTAIFENNPKYDPQTYLKTIPDKPQVLDSLEQERNFAYYQLGLIYKEKFEENELAAEKLELLLKSNPEERLILPAKYNLFKIYSELGNKVKAQAIKTAILHNFPDSRYAKILENPGVLIENKNRPELLYKEIYHLYEKQEYEEVIKKSSALVEEFPGDRIVPKLELLKALALGRLKGFEAYKEALNYVALTFPQSEEGKKAQDLYANALPAIVSKDFIKNSEAKSFKLIFPFEKSNPEVVAEFQKKLQELIEEKNYRQLNVSMDIYNPEKVFIVIYGFAAPGKAIGFKKLLQEDEKVEIDTEPFYISSENYGVLQIHKNLDSYLNEFQE